MWRRPFVVSEGWDLAPAPVVAADGSTMDEGLARAGWVVVRVRYEPRAHDGDEFMCALRALGRSRLRNGARTWRCHRHTATAGNAVTVVESFMFPSWADWLRHQERRVVADQLLEERVRGLLAPQTTPDSGLRIVAG